MDRNYISVMLMKYLKTQEKLADYVLYRTEKGIEKFEKSFRKHLD